MGSYSVRARLVWPARAAAVVIAIVAASALTGGCTPSASPAAVSQVRMSRCGGALRAQPDVVNVTCLNNSIMARHLRWSSWGGPVATATGSAVVDLCAYEDCYAGDYVTVPIVIITSKIVRCSRSAHAYSEMQYVFVGRSPYAGVPAGISVPDGANSPANPRDQTVSLVC
jgi:hypothetical protein